METMQTVIGESHALNTALDHISNLAGIDRSILVTGERGTGKEIAANRLHFLSSRWQGPFIKLNCASLPENLLDSELFGYEPGAFTGARRSHQGRFERADGGTLFLDELGTMPLALQEKLLRVIEYGELERIGGSETIKVDVRIVAATNADLPAMAAKGEFRWDLLDRLTFDVVNMPPLRTRGGDITLLAEHFAVRFAAESGWHHFPGFSPNAKSKLYRYEWPGNVRELRNVIERSLHRQGEDGEQIADLVINPWSDRHIDMSETTLPEKPPTNALDSELPKNLRAALEQQEASWLEQALDQTANNQKQAAALLGLSYDQIRGLMRKHGLRSRSLRT
jgi:psp operon transcriptional activator